MFKKKKKTGAFSTFYFDGLFRQGHIDAFSILVLRRPFSSERVRAAGGADGGLGERILLRKRIEIPTVVVVKHVKNKSFVGNATNKLAVNVRTDSENPKYRAHRPVTRRRFPVVCGRVEGNENAYVPPAPARNFGRRRAKASLSVGSE